MNVPKTTGIISNYKKNFKTYRRYLFLLLLPSVLVLTGVVFLLASRPDSAKADWFNDNWLYRKPITVSKTVSSETQVYISFDDAYVLDTSDTDKFQGDCGDLRFVKENGEILPYYINSGCGTSSTDIDVYLDSIAVGDVVIYMYYGNQGATNGFESSGFSTEATNYTIGSPGTEENSPGPGGYWKFSEGYGTNTNDSTLNNNDGTISGATWQQEDMCITDKCLYFDGSDDVVTVSADPSIDLNGKSGYSVCGWINPNSDGEGDAGEWFSKGNSYVRVDTESAGTVEVSASLDLATTDATYNTTRTIKTSSWTYVCVVYMDDADDELTVYINGQDVGSSADGDGSPADDSASDLYIGGDTSNNFHGKIDEFKIYSYARSAEEVKVDYVSQGSVHGIAAKFSAEPPFLSEGLIGYWKMDDPTADSEGGTITDLSGNGNPGTLYGDNGSGDNGSGMDCTAGGKFSSGCDMDGTDDYVSLGNASTLQNIPNDNFSVSVWFKADTLPTSTDARAQLLSKGRSDDIKWFLGFRGTSSATQLDFSIDNSAFARSNESIVGLSTGQWYHLTVTYDDKSPSRKPRMYLNGTEITYILQSSMSGTYSGDTSNNLIIGGNYDATQFFDGSLDEVRIYNRTLSPAEVQSLYKWAPGPEVYLKMDENSGSTTYDTSGNERDGTINNGTWGDGVYGSGVELDGTDDSVQILDF